MKKLLGIGIGLATAAVLAVSAMAAGTVTITGNTTLVENTPGGWYFNRDAGTSSPYSFTTTAAKIGVGSLYVQPIDNVPTGSDKFIGEHYMQVPLASVTTISFDFLLGPGNPVGAHEQFYWSIYANFGGSSPTKFYDCRYDVVPATGSTTSWTTVTFNPNVSTYNVTTRTGSQASPFPCPATPAGMNTLSPGSTVRAAAINVGDSSTSDTNVNGYLDNVVVNLSGDTTTFNFDPYAVATDKDQCKDGGWQTLKRANGTPFKNQGDCVSYTNNGR